MGKRIIRYIAENENYSRRYVNQLRTILPNSVTVEAISPPHSQKEDYLPVLDDSETVCFVIDQKLKNSGMATCAGIELARYLRSLNSKIPIYMLTNEAEHDECIGGEWSVDEIISKGRFCDAKWSRVIAARLIRRLDVYEDIFGQRQKRFRELLRKSLNDELAEAELQELDQLQFERMAPTLAREAAELTQLEQLTMINQSIFDHLTQATGDV